jgi:hypothetical protein
MKIASAALALLLVAVPALAADDAPPPDFSRDGIQRVFVVDLYKPPEPQPFDWQRMFMLDWTTLGTRVHFRPILAPLSGSIPTSSGLVTPNPLELTGTSLPWTYATWTDQRALSAERRHVERLIRRKTHIVVNAP